MRRFFRGGVAVLLGLALAACGGGDDADAQGQVSVDGDSVNGSFALCAANADGFTSAQTVLTFTDTTATVGLRQYLGTRCQGPAFVSIRFPLVLLTGTAPKSVTGPSGGSVTGVRFSASSSGGSLTVETGSEYVRVVNGELQVVVPNTGTVVYRDDLVQAEFTGEKDVRVNVGGQLYFGRADGPVDADGYPAGIDYTEAWQRL